MFTATSLASEEQERMAISQSFVAEAEVFDPFFGIRISNPKITLDTLNSFCSGIRKLQLNQINNAVCAQNNGEEWVTMGVLVERTECKKSANGNEYMIWRISDLKGLDAATVKVLLFGDSVRHYWKLQPGNTILLNNPQRADNPTATGNSGGSNECTVSLKVFKLGQIIELGFCPDFGQCQGRKAADGAQCTHFVNKARSLYCPFHLQQRARQVAANRGSLNRSANLPPKKWRQFKEPTTASFGQEEPTGLTTLSRRQSAAAAGGKSKTFTAPFSMVQRGLKRRLDTTESPETAKANLLAEEKLSTSTHSKNLRIMRRQNGHWDPKGDARMLQTPALKSMREFIQSQPPPKPAQNRLTPSFSSPPSTMTSPLELDAVELMKRKKAAQILRNKNADAPINGSSDSKQSKVGLENEEENATGKPSSSSKGSLLGTAFSTEQLQALLHKKSTHEAEADQEELNRQNSYFERGEVDEQIETNATSLMEIKGCRVVSCKECEYTSVHQSVYCKSQGHPVRRHQANKRFFKCMDCQRRTICFDRMPTKACLGCKSKRFCRVAMRDERKVLLETEKLKIKEEENNFSTTADH